jgi:AbrB family looped-hinge helix DNA binding protein
MRVTIDRAGRVVVPKSLRDVLGLSPDTPLEIELVEDHLELSALHEPPAVIDGPHGPLVAATGVPISDEDVRRALEAAREHR